MQPHTYIFLNERIEKLLANFEDKFSEISTPEQSLISDTIKKIDMYLHMAQFSTDEKMIDAYVDLLEQYLTYGYIQESTQNLLMNVYFETIESAMFSLFAVCEKEGLLNSFPTEYIKYHNENRELFAKQVAEYKAMNEKMEADRRASIAQAESEIAQNKLESEDEAKTADSTNDINLD